MKDYNCLKGMIANSETMMKMAYDKGYEHGYVEGQKHDLEHTENIVRSHEKCKSVLEAEYERGVKDMFDAFTKLAYGTRNGGYSGDEIEEIFGTTYEPEILKKFADNPLLLIENIKEYEERKKQEEGKPAAYCGFLDMMCPYKISCVSCDVQKAHKAATAKAKEIKDGN